MPAWLDEALRQSAYFMPHGHCYLWIGWVLWMHVGSDLLIGAAYVGISLILWGLVRRLRLPFSPVFVAFGLFIGLCGGTHFMEIWTAWHPDYIQAGLLKAATAIASVATAIGLVYVKPQIEAVVQAARLSEERRASLEVAHGELEVLFARVKQLDGLRTQFFANVSHELRTPLTLILAPAERLLQDDSLDEAQRRHVRTIQANGVVLLRHVNVLLDIARLEAGQAQLHLQSVDAGPWLRRVASQFDALADARGVALRVAADDGCIAAFDVDKMERVIVNLVANALRFTPAGGLVRVELACPAGQVRLTVADSGPGIPEAQREAVFERFRQVDGGTTRMHGGTGLGLAIVREFVALHGGHVELDDAPEGGARFAVTLPVRAGDAASEADADAPAASDGTSAQTAFAAARHALAPEPTPGPSTASARAGAGRVLVVEDNAEMRDFIAHTLAERFDVVTAVDGEDGLARARACAPDLVLTDLMMPRLGGDGLVAALRREEAFATVPVVMLTARAEDEVRVAMLREGVQDVLAKPFGPAELLARVSNLVAAKQAGDVLRAELATLSTDLGDLALRVTSKNRQLQAALREAELARREAEHAGKVKGYFLGMISHELRSPLAALNLNLQLLSRDPSMPPAMQPRLARIERSARQMTGLIENLLEHTRIEAGRIDAKVRPAQLEPLAHELVEAHRDEAAPGVGLRLDMPGPLPPLRTDPDLLRVAVGNLLSNALKFTTAGEVVLRVSVDAAARGHRIEVVDTGIGIAATDLERIFEPFEQAVPLQRKSTPGIGLGLALVRAIVEGLGGSVEVESRPGTGSTFRLRLPSGPAAEPAE